jgi:hypothetical protein
MTPSRRVLPDHPGVYCLTIMPCTELQGLRETGSVGRVLSWDEFLQWGAAHPRDAIPPTADDISTIMYTRYVPRTADRQL